MPTTARHFRAFMTVVLSLLLVALGLPTVASADTTGEFTLESYVTGHENDVPTISAGDAFTYTVNVQCSDPDTGKCTNAVLTFDLPDPLKYGDTPFAISPAVATGSVSGQKLTLTFNDGKLTAGQLVAITVRATLPDSASANLSGDTVNAAIKVTADNADTVTDAVSAKLDIPTKLAATTTKAVSPTSTQPALAGRSVTYTITGANDSNAAVDSLTIAEPSDPMSSTPFSALAVTDITTLTAPEGADKVAFSWYDGTSWHDGSAVDIPDDPSSLLDSITLTDIKGMKFVFSKADGSVTAGGDAAKIVVKTVTRSGAFDSLANGESTTVADEATTTVAYGSKSDSDAASASASFKKTAVEVTAAKAIVAGSLVAGKSTLIALTATNGIMPVSKIQIAEPGSGADLVTQGLTFTKWVTSGDLRVTWPEGATTADVSFTYSDDSTETLSTNDVDSLPAPDSAKRVKSFSVTFTGADDAIVSGASAMAAFNATADTVTVEDGVEVTDTTTVTATTAAGSSDTDNASDTITLLPQRVRTSVTKKLSRTSLWAAPGSTMTVSLTGAVSDESTIGSDYLTLTDDTADFWDRFNLVDITRTDIPSGSTLTVQYRDADGNWQTLATQAGTVSDWSYAPTTPDVIDGLRFVFTPTTGSALPVGFNVAPRFRVKLRSSLRSDASTSTNPDADFSLTNTATSEVSNSLAITKTVSATSDASFTLRKTGTGGSGAPDMIRKYWVASTGLSEEGTTQALSGQTGTAQINWDTDGLSMSQMVITDDPRGTDGNSIANSAYNAFDLVAIEGIDSDLDSLIEYDKVSKVELYNGSTWVDITSAACPSTSDCDGRFTGYHLTDAERASTLGVRLTFTAGSASTTGAVAISGDSTPSRGIKLAMKLRNTLRSDSKSYVLGTSHSYTYNSGSAGVVNNQASVVGTLASDSTTTYSDTSGANMLIYDRPLNVSFSKVFDQSVLGLPPATTAQTDYPLITSTLTATNNTATDVPEIKISDPNPSVSGLGAYDYLNLYQITSTALPDDLDTSDVTVDLTRYNSSTATTTTETISFDAALALSSTDLADVVGVTVHYGAEANLADSSANLIATEAVAKLKLTYQLRATVRSTGAATTTTDEVTNTAEAAIVSPGGTDANVPEVSDSDTFRIANPSYAVTAGKAISPSSRYEDENNSYTITLAGQPSGTARTKLLTLTDDTPTFWNAFDLTAIPTITVPTPVNQLRLSVLTGVAFSYDSSGNVLSYTCGGATDLTNCWHSADWVTAADGKVTLSLPSGISYADVRGVKVAARSVDTNGDAVQWERPATPTVSVALTATQRGYLVYGRDGSSTTPVPSTRPGMTTAPGESAQGTTTNTVTAVGEAGWLTQGNTWTATSSTTASTQLLHRVNKITVVKTPGKTSSDASTPSYDLDETIPFKLKITNSGDWEMTGLNISDQIGTIETSSGSGEYGSGLVEADVTSVFTFTVDGLAVPGFSASLNTTTGALSITVPDGFVLEPNSLLLITANLKFRDYLDVGTVVSNSVSLTSDRDFEECDYTTDALAQTALANVTTCSATTKVKAAASTPMTVTKTVKGVGAGDPAVSSGTNYDDLGVIDVGASDATACANADADGYYAAPCVPITRPGGTERWKLTMTNGGNVAANTVSLIDVLPAVGDTGVTVGTARKSRFNPIFAGNVNITYPSGTTPTATLYYATSTATPACYKSDILNDTTPAGVTNCGLTWHTFTNGDFADPTGADASLAASVQAIKVVVSYDSDDTTGIAPGGVLGVTFDTITPAQTALADATTVEPIAWNSAAIGTRTARVEATDDSVAYPARASLITEPRKAGVAIASGQIDLAKTVSIPSDATWGDALHSSYTGSLSCTSLGETVSLTGTSTSTDTQTVTLAGVNGNGTSATVDYNADGSSTLPLFATCSFEETPAQGANPSYSAATVVAQHDYTSVANIAHPWAGDGTPLLGITNTFYNAGFTVSKLVSGPQPLDANGSEVAFKDFAFTATCDFNGTTVLDSDFTLPKSTDPANPATKTFDGLPAGATCSVTETYAGGAASTSASISASAVTQSYTDGAEFTLLSGDATTTKVSYDNAYATGAVKITKTVDDSTNLWGNADFEARLLCTDDDAAASDSVVYDGTVTLNKTTTSQTIYDLPTGASCTVTETKTGGANTTTITGGTFTVSDNPDDPSQVGITNTFTTGKVKVTKTVQANGVATSAEPWVSGTYPVTLACTRSVNGSDVAITVPDEATRNLTSANNFTTTYANLPTGATCAVTEASAGSVSGQPDPEVTITDPVTVGNATTANIGVTNNFRAGTLVINKTLTGAGASFFSGATFDVSCTLDAKTVFTASDVAVSSIDLKSAPLGPLPFGASCQVSETDTGGADATPGDNTVVITKNDATSDMNSTTFENKFSAGTVTVSKAVDGDAAAATWATTPTFDLAVKCGLKDAGPYSYDGTVSLKAGQSAVLQNDGSNQLFPVGTHCWAAENAAHGAVNSVVDHDSFSNAAVVTAQSDPTVVQSLAIGATNTFTYSGFTVTKDVVTTGATDQSGAPLTYNPTFTFTTSCTFDGANVLTDTFSLSNSTSSAAGTTRWGSTTYDHLPTGAVCTVTETGTGSATSTGIVVKQADKSDTSVSGTTASFTLVKGHSTGTTGDPAANVAAVTNTYGIGDVTITKALDISTTGYTTAAKAWAYEPFTVRLVCTSTFAQTSGASSTIYDSTVTMQWTTTELASLTSSTNKKSATITNLPTGATCAVSEPVDGGANTTTYTNQTPTVGDGTTVTSTVTNTFTQGTAKVQKYTRAGTSSSFTDVSGKLPWSNTQYAVTLTCVRDVGTSNETITKTGTITGANSVSWPMPTGATCAVAETGVTYPTGTPTQPDYTVSVTGTTISGTGSYTLGVYNYFAYGNVQATKTVDGDGATLWGGGTFTFGVSCTMLQGSTQTTVYTTTLTAKRTSGNTFSSTKSGPIPVGSTCAVTETNTAGATSTTPSSAVTVDTIDNVLSGGTTKVAAFTNTYKLTGFTVTKTVNNGGALDQNGLAVKYTDSYAFSATCTYNNGVSTTATALAATSFSLKAGESQTFSNLPVGASCTVTETGTANANSVGYTITKNGTGAGSGSTAATSAFTLVRASDDSASAGATVVGFTNNYTTGTLAITKATDGAGAGTWDTGSFTLRTACTLSGATANDGNTQVYNDTATLTKGQTWTIPNLPYRASCTITEEKDGGANAIAISNATPAIGNGTTTAITVTNTFTTGSVSITKALKVNGQDTTAEPWASATYEMTLSCTKDFNNDGAAETLDLNAVLGSGYATKTVTGAGTATWAGLPQGAICGVTEGTITYPVETPTQPAPSSVTSTGQVTVSSTTQAVTITNNFDYGTVQITKNLTGDGVTDWGGQPYTFDVACTLDGSTGNVFTKTGITLQRSGTETTLTSDFIGPIPQGAACTATETSKGWATSVSPSKTQSFATILANTNVGVTFTNTFALAGFTVSKAVSTQALDAADHPVAYTGNYGFTASCKIGDHEFLTAEQQSFTLTDGTAKTFTGLPTGADCTVTETNTRGAATTTTALNQTGSSQVDATSTSASFTLVSGDQTANTVAFTNGYTTGGLDITKAITGSGAGAWGGGNFTVQAVCTLDADADSTTPEVEVYNGTRVLKATQTWELRKLPTGAHCTLSETQAAGANSTTIDVPNPTITAGNQAITVTNTFNTGSLKITKAITANGTDASALKPWSTGSYPVTISCTKDFNNDGTAETLDLSVLGADYATKTITGAGTATWSGLPQGATCTASEGTSVVTGQNQPTTVTIGSTAIGSSTIANLTLTNAYAAGKLQIHKDITGDANTTWGTGPFTFDVTCTQTGYGTVFSASGITLTPTTGQTSLDSAVLGPIPFTASCTATETSAAGATATISPAAVTISENAATGDVNTASFTNRFDYAGFTVTKAVSSTAADNTGALITYKPASFTASCTFKGAEAITNTSDRTFTLSGGDSKKFENLPAGASCTVTETDTQSAASTSVTTVNGTTTLDSGTKTATTFTVAHSDATATATTATFTNSYTTGSVAITKSVTGSGASLWGTGPFTVKLVCTSALTTNATVFSAVDDLVGGETWTVPNLPTGASCTVTEEKAAGANSTTITPGSLTVGTTTKDVSVTNTFTAGVVKVTKALTVNSTTTEAHPWIDGTYTVKLACTRSYNGSTVAIDIPGDSYSLGDDLDGVRTITGNGSATYTDLPTGATCAASEVSSSPAAYSTAVTDSVTVGSNPSSPQTITVTNDFHTRTMTIAKQLEGAGQASFGNGPFTFNVACTLPVNGADTKVYNQSDISLERTVSTDTVLHSSAIGPIPVGAVCTVTETDSGGADFTPDPVTLTITDDAAANVAGISNQFSAGTVYVSKVLAGDAKGESWATEATFDVLVTCEADFGSGRVPVFSNTVSLKGGERVNALDGSRDPSRVPLGSRCWARETDSQGATSAVTNYTDWDHAAVVTSGTPAELQELELTATNTYEYAGFTVSKQVSDSGATDAGGAGVAHTGTFTFDADCTLNGSSVLDKSFTLAHVSGALWATQSYTGLPAGAACTVTETDSAGAAQTSSVVTTNGIAGTTSGATASFALARGSALFSEDSPNVNVVAFTNTYKVGSLKVTKAFAGAGANAWGNTSFDVAVACTADLDADGTTADTEVYSASKTLTKAAPTWQIDNLVAGATCTVTETAWGGATSHSARQEATVAADDTTEVTVTNTFAVGSIQVTKAFTVNGSTPQTGWADQLSQASATVGLTCSREVNGTATSVDVPDGATRTLNAANSFTASYDGLPAGATCQLSETASSPVANAVSYSDDTPVVPSSDTAKVTVTNDYHTGTLTIDKVVTGAGAAYGVGPFVFSVSCGLNGLSDPVYTNSSVSLTASNLTSDELGPIPVGAVCDVTETDAAGASTPAAAAQVTIPDSLSTGNAANLTMTNDFATSTLTVTKAIDNGGALDANGEPVTYPGEYEFTATCSFESTSELLGVDDQDFTLGDGDSRTITGLPQGTSCKVTETGKGNAVSTSVAVGTDASATGSSVSVIIGAEPKPITFTNHYLTGAATITKQLTGAGADAWGAGPFVLRTYCTLDTDHNSATDPAVVYNGTAELTSSNLVWNLTRLASGAECTVSEEASGGANTAATDQSFTVGSDEAEPSQVTMTNDFTVGSVIVTKKILVDGEVSSAEPYASGIYTMSLSCTRTVNGTAQSITIPGGATRTITGAGTATFSSLPRGADCSLSESSSTLAVSPEHVTIDNSEFTVGEEPVAATVTNAFVTSSLVVVANFSGVGKEKFAKPLTVEVNCTLAGATGSVYAKTLTLRPEAGKPTASSGPLGPIPVGAVCTVTTTSANGADRVPSVVSVTGESNTVVEADVAATYSAGTVSVVKKLAGWGAVEHHDTTFTFAVTCRASANGPAVAQGTLHITGAGTATLSDSSGQPILVPAGTRCWATETGNGGAVRTSVDHSSYATGLSIVADAPQKVQHLTVTVTNWFDPTDDLAYTGAAIGWGLPAVGLLAIGLGVWLTRRRRGEQ